MRQGTVSARGRLVVVPIPEGIADVEVLSAVRSFLADHTGVPHCAALVTWDEDGSLVARDIEPDRGDESTDSTGHTLHSALGALLAELFGTRVRASWRGAGQEDTAPLVDELSMSFLREVHDFVTPTTSFIALLADWVDPGAIVRALQHIGGMRVIYGGVPSLRAAHPADTRQNHTRAVSPGRQGSVHAHSPASLTFGYGVQPNRAIPAEPPFPEAAMNERSTRASWSPPVASRFVTPALPAVNVRRPRLLHELDSAVRSRVTSVTAPTGFGKSVL